MSVRKHPKKPNCWIIDYYPKGRKGKRFQRQFIGSEAEAIAVEMELRRAYAVSTPIHPKIIDITPEWFKYYKINRMERTYRDALLSFKKIIPFFGKLFINQLTPTIIEQYKAQRLETGIKKMSINKELAYFSSMLNWAIENDHAHPLPFKIKKFKHEKPPLPKILDKKEINDLYKEIDEKYKLMFLLMSDSGLRLDETINFKAENVLLNKNLIFIQGKGNKERIIPIPTKRLAKKLQTKLKEVKTGFLFINPNTKKPYKDIKKALQRATKKAGIKRRVSHHLLRHSFATNSLIAGVDMRAIQGALGHSDIRTTQIYAQIAGGYLQDEFKKFNHYTSK